MAPPKGGASLIADKINAPAGQFELYPDCRSYLGHPMFLLILSPACSAVRAFLWSPAFLPRWTAKSDHSARFRKDDLNAVAIIAIFESAHPTLLIVA
jgi:hypothetical protein